MLFKCQKKSALLCSCPARLGLTTLILINDLSTFNWQPSTYQRAMAPKIARCLSFYYPKKHKRKIHLLSLLLGSCPIHSFPCLLSSQPHFQSPESRRHAWSLGYLLLCLKYNWNSFSDTHTWVCSSSQTLGSRISLFSQHIHLTVLCDPE